MRVSGRYQGGGRKGGRTHDGVDIRLDILLLRLEPHPHGAHHDRQTKVHGHPDPVRDHVAVALDEGPVQQREHQAREPGPVALPGRVHEVRLARLLALAVLDNIGELLRQRARHPRAPRRPQPLLRRRLAFSSFTLLLPSGSKVNTNLVEQELSRVNMQRQRLPNRLIIRPHRPQRAKEVRLPGAEEQELIKKVKSRRGRLVYTSHNNKIIPPRHRP